MSSLLTWQPLMMLLMIILRTPLPPPTGSCRLWAQAQIAFPRQGRVRLQLSHVPVG